MKVNKETPPTVNRRRGKRRRLWSRTKVKKKPKFLSLSANFPANDQTNDDDRAERIAKRCVESVQIDEIKECHDHENVALFFSGGEGGSTTLTGLLDATVAGEIAADLSLANNSSSSRLDELSPSSASPTYGYGSKDPTVLVRNALRSKERDSSEEKWVCYSEVVERKEIVVKEEEVTSSAVDRRSGIGRLSLKLDYEEILTVWSDKGRPLYINAESSRIVPDDFNHDDEFNFSHGCMSGEGNIGLWTVPEILVRDSNNNAVEEMKKNDKEEVTNISEEIESKTNMEMASRHREASLLRYKEKRLNRLFSKTIRYQVRKLNAEKRPRLKGRFIKRS